MIVFYRTIGLENHRNLWKESILLIFLKPVTCFKRDFIYRII